MLFYRPAEELQILWGGIPNVGGGLYSIGLCLAIMAFEPGWIFIVPHLQWLDLVFCGLIPKTFSHVM